MDFERFIEKINSNIEYKTIVKKVLSNEPCALQDAKEYLKDDKELVLFVSRFDRLIGEHISTNLKKDKEFLLEFSKYNHTAPYFMDDSLRTNKKFLLDLGMEEENIRLRDHSPEELVFYSKATTDIEFAFPFGWGELWGIADRTDYDLSRHMEHSKQDLSYQDPETNEKYIPYVIEPSLGCDRVALAFLCNAYEEQDLGEGDSRVVLHLHPALAPYKVAVLPLSKKLSEKAQEVYENLSKKFMCDYDEAGSIGKRYRREDEIGTPYCVTIDFDTLEDNKVTIRDRDTMEQVRIDISEIENWLQEKMEF
jgi:glycyl-tRNA synthetase